MWARAVSIPWNVDRTELTASKLHLWLSSIKLETQGSLGTQSPPLWLFLLSLSLYLCLCLLSVIMKCAIIVTQKQQSSMPFRLSALALREWKERAEKHQSEKKDKAIQEKKERERGNWLGYHFPCDRHVTTSRKPGASHLVRQRNLVRLKVKTG